MKVLPKKISINESNKKGIKFSIKNDTLTGVLHKILTFNVGGERVVTKLCFSIMDKDVCIYFDCCYVL